MGQMKFETVGKSRKEHTCGRCRTVLAKGESYRKWTEFQGRTIVRCLDDDCTPRASELETNERKATLMCAFEAIADMIDPTKNPDLDLGDLHDLLEEKMEEIREAAEAYEAVADNMGGNGPIADLAEEFTEFADALDNVLSSLSDARDYMDDDTVVDEDIFDPENLAKTLRFFGVQYGLAPEVLDGLTAWAEGWEEPEGVTHGPLDSYNEEELVEKLRSVGGSQELIDMVLKVIAKDRETARAEKLEEARSEVCDALSSAPSWAA